jgi:hypothetical protein
MHFTSNNPAKPYPPVKAFSGRLGAFIGLGPLVGSARTTAAEEINIR